VSSVDLSGANRRSEDPRLFDSYGSHVSPDGRRRVFASQDGEVFLSRLDGSKARNVTNTPGVPEFDPAFAPDMSAVVFGRAGPTLPGNSIVVLDLETGAERTISPPGLIVSAPDWGAIPVNCGGRRANLVGTEGRDKLVGTKGADVIAALGGRDKISGKGGKDRLCGGSGRDRLNGGKGKKDRCLGGKGRDDATRCERTKSA
jgi:Ca2+-binding RTX toxin-like protein